MKPHLISGNQYKDQRGFLFYNNDFDVSSIKRMYIIENASTNFVRAWQGHSVEQRWFSTVEGCFIIKLIEIDNWENPNIYLPEIEFVLRSDSLNVLHIPKGYVTSIQAMEDKSKLLVMADYHLGEIQDEFRYPQNYFIKK